ncbi:hypothetical protein Ancab_010090 [Ancistrocladus abbreviatus]
MLCGDVHPCHQIIVLLPPSDQPEDIRSSRCFCFLSLDLLADSLLDCILFLFFRPSKAAFLLDRSLSSVAEGRMTQMMFLQGKPLKLKPTKVNLNFEPQKID